MQDTMLPFGFAAGLVLAGAACASPIANSVSDFGDQGDGGWFYGYTDQKHYETPDDFVMMSFRSPTSWRHAPTATWTFGNGTYLHGNGPNASRDDDVQDAIRRWVSPVAGDVVLSGVIADADLRAIPASNGATASIWIDGMRVYEFEVVLGDDLGTAYEIEASLSVGTVIDYVLSSDGDPTYDTTLFTSRIDLVPGPSVLAVAGVSVYALRRRRGPSRLPRAGSLTRP